MAQQDLAHRSIWQDNVLLACMAGAVLLHIILLSIHFVAPQSGNAAMQDITIAVHLSPQKIQNADYKAQADQQGSGTLRNAHKLTSPEQQTAEQDQQEIAEQQQNQTQQQKQTTTASEQVLVTTLSWQQHARNPDLEQQSQQQIETSPDMAQVAMIASLEAQYAKRKQEYSRKTSIHTIDSVSAQADPSAAYMHQFIQKVEQLGNKHYPLEARARKLHGEVQLMVILATDGSIRAIRLLHSSGYPVLDEAAKDSVRQAAPFGAFDKNMKDYSELRIIRTWRFSEKLDDVGVQ